MSGYTKTFSKTTGATVEVTDLGTEANNLEAAFNNTTGHAHDGTSAEGPVIGLIGDAGVVSPLNKVEIDTVNDRISFAIDVASSSVDQYYVEDGVIYPVTDSDVDLGTTSLRFKTLYVDDITLTNTLADAAIAESSVTQHEAALTITESQISDLGTSALLTSDLGVSVQAYDADTAKYDAVTANFTGTLQYGGVEVATLDDISAIAGVTYETLDAAGDVGTGVGQLAIGNHTHTGVYEPANANLAELTDITYERLNTNGDVGTSAGTLAIGNHTHTGVYEPANANLAELTDITYERLNTNGDVGTSAGTLAIGNHTHSGVYEPADAAIAKKDELSNFTAGLQSGGVAVATTATNWAAGDIVSGTFTDARIAQTNVTQHQAALSITGSQISDWSTVVKASNEFTTFDIVVSDDNTLKLTSPTAASYYIFEIHAIVASDNASNGGMDYTVLCDGTGAWMTATASYDGDESVTTLNSEGAETSITLTTTDQNLVITGIMYTGTAPSKITFQWAQTTSSAAAAIVQAHSWATFRKV